MSEIIVSVDRALDVILTLYANGDEMGVSDISRELELRKSTVHRILATLRNKGFVVQNEDNGKYWLGIKFYALGTRVREKLVFIDLLKPYAKKLFDEFHEVVNVSILDTDISGNYKSAVVLKEVDDQKTLSVNPRLGQSMDIHVSAVGKCLAAFSKNIDTSKFRSLKKHTDNTITNYEDFLEELAKVRENGYAIDNEEKEIGLTCIGAPILDRDGYAIAAISLSGPTVRMKQGDFNYKLSKLKKTAAEIEELVKYLS